MARILSFLTGTVDSSSGTLEWVIYIAREYWEMFLNGTILTLYIAFLGTFLGFLLGFFVGIIRDLRTRPEDGAVKTVLVKLLKAVAAIYTEVFRGTPMIVQAMIVYYGLRGVSINISPVNASIIVTLLNTGAYMAETVRAGIDSIDNGQREGSLAMGMSPIGTMFYVILPQAFVNIIPEMGNNFLTNLKMTSVLNVIGVSELFLTAKTAGGTYYRYFESYLVIAVIYLVLSILFGRLLMLLEKRLKKRGDYVLAMELLDEDDEG